MDKFPRIYNIDPSLGDPEGLEKKEHRAGKFQRLDHFFVSMFNDIEWRNNDENCISNADQFKNYSNRFLPGHWTSLGPGSEKWYGSTHGWTVGPYSQQNDTAIQRNWSSYLHKYQCFESRHFETKKTQKYHFQTIPSVDQASICAVVTNWCYKFALNKEAREHIPTPVDNRIMANMEPEEVQMLIYSTNQAQGT